MKVLVATKETQGQRANDFFWSTPGELVTPGMVCGGENDPDGYCGCSRAFSGVESHKGTTTFKVVDDERSDDELLNFVTRNMVDAWGAKNAHDVACEQIKGMREVADQFDVGDILEFRLDFCQTREA